MPVLLKSLSDPRAFRNQLKITQTAYWPLFGATQSAGCRYESGRPLAEPLAMLFALFENGVITWADLKKSRALAKGEPFHDEDGESITKAQVRKFRKRMADLKGVRVALDINQTYFWYLFGTTQGIGSRYEKGIGVPPPVVMLHALFFLERVTLDSLLPAIQLVENATRRKVTSKPIKGPGRAIPIPQGQNAK